MKSILITGASGFVGSFLIEEALRQGFETWAGVRATSSRRYLQEPGTRFLELDFGLVCRHVARIGHGAPPLYLCQHAQRVWCHP